MDIRDAVIKSSIAASVDNAPTEWKANYLMLAKVLFISQYIEDKKEPLCQTD